MRNTWKSIVLLILAIALVLSLVGCGTIEIKDDPEVRGYADTFFDALVAGDSDAAFAAVYSGVDRTQFDTAFSQMQEYVKDVEDYTLDDKVVVDDRMKHRWELRFSVPGSTKSPAASKQRGLRFGKKRGRKNVYGDERQWLTASAAFRDDSLSAKYVGTINKARTIIVLLKPVSRFV